MCLLSAVGAGPAGLGPRVPHAAPALRVLDGPGTETAEGQAPSVCWAATADWGWEPVGTFSHFGGPCCRPARRLCPPPPPQAEGAVAFTKGPIASPGPRILIS